MQKQIQQENHRNTATLRNLICTQFILIYAARGALNLQDLKMADQKRTKTGKCKTWKMTDPGTAKFCACLRKNAKEQVVTVRMYRAFNFFFRIISRQCQTSLTLR